MRVWGNQANGTFRLIAKSYEKWGKEICIVRIVVQNCLIRANIADPVV
ncbi:MAG: hypothetical protein ACI4EG_14175 [Fusicatenibacter sp.]